MAPAQSLEIILDCSFSHTPRPVSRQILSASPSKWTQNLTASHHLVCHLPLAPRHHHLPSRCLQQPHLWSLFCSLPSTRGILLKPKLDPATSNYSIRSNYSISQNRGGPHLPQRNGQRPHHDLQACGISPQTLSLPPSSLATLASWLFQELTRLMSTSAPLPWLFPHLEYSSGDI